MRKVRIRGEEVRAVKRKKIKRKIKMIKWHTNTQMKEIVDITGRDKIGRKEVVYIIKTKRMIERIRIRTIVKEEEGIKSITGMVRGAEWLERELYDMLGIEVKEKGKRKKRRILTDYTIRGHPLEKTYPLCGYTEVRYDETRTKSVTRTEIEITQEYREYTYKT